jgi:hypothetical protein
LKKVGGSGVFSGKKLIGGQVVKTVKTFIFAAPDKNGNTAFAKAPAATVLLSSVG